MLADVRLTCETLIYIALSFTYVPFLSTLPECSCTGHEWWLTSDLGIASVQGFVWCAAACILLALVCVVALFFFIRHLDSSDNADRQADCNALAKVRLFAGHTSVPKQPSTCKHAD